MKFSFKDLVAFTEEILNRRLYFLCSVCCLIIAKRFWTCTMFQSVSLKDFFLIFLIKNDISCISKTCNSILIQHFNSILLLTINLKNSSRVLEFDQYDDGLSLVLISVLKKGKMLVMSLKRDSSG